MFKKYSNHKRSHKTECHPCMKTISGKILPIEQGYSHYLGKTLMKQMQHEISNTEEDEHIAKEPDHKVVDESEIKKVIHKLHKCKAPKISAIPITYHD